MKKILVIISYLIVISSCHQSTTQKPEQYSITVAEVVDFTDKKILWPTPDPALMLFACDQHPDASCTFGLYAITDKKINPSFAAYLPDDATTNRLNKHDDAQFRNKCVVNFYSAVRKDFKDAYHEFDTASAMSYSECWSTITTSLQSLTQTESHEKVLIIASDLMEKSDIYNAYKQLSHMTAEAIARKFQSAIAVPKNLKGVNIFFVFQPKTREEDKCYSKMLKVYKELLQPSGTIIHVQANSTEFKI